MKFIELFAGIGGFRLGLESINTDKLQAQSGKWNGNKREKNKGYNSSITGKRRENTTNLTNTITKRIQQGVQQESKNNSTIVKPLLGTKQFTCVYANEWDKYACQIYRKNFGGKELYEGDITKISAESIPNHDLLTAGFPCQSFSIAGKRKGFRDTRGTLFFEICRIVEKKKPNLLLLENVKGLLNHDGGETFRIILDSLSELGYDCEWEVLNSKNFGVPQNRERVFIVGHFRGEGGQKVFPIGEGNQIHNGNKDEKCARSLAATCYKGIGNDGMPLIRLDEKPKGRDQEMKRVYSVKGLAPALHLKTGGWQEPKIMMNTLTEALGTRQGSSKEYIKSVKNINEAIGQIRRLTPTECERLQSFPDGWTEGISDTQRYKCLGNAITVNVVEEIGRKLIND